MAIRTTKSIEVTCDTCKKVIATGRCSTVMIDTFEKEERFTQIFCTDCVKLTEEITIG